MRYLTYERSLLVVFVALLSLSHSGAAQALDTMYYSTNRILYYDPDAVECATGLEASDDTTEGGGSDGSANVTITGKDSQERAWNFLTGKGLTPEQAAAIMGNIMAESSFDPRASNGGRYIGIAQWDSAGRWAALVRWAKANKLDEWKFDTQIKYLWKEGSDRGNIAGLKKHRPQTVSNLTWFWGRFFEVAIISGDPDRYPFNLQHFKDAREPAAERFFKQFGSSPGSASATTGGDDGSGDIAAPQCASETDEENSSDGSSEDGSIGAGQGNFKDNGEVQGWDIVRQNAILTDKVWGNKMEWKGYCAAIVARVWKGVDTGFGYSPEYAMTIWKSHRGLVKTNHNAPKGSILLYTGGTRYGHVTIYLGNNRILNDGHIVNASTKANDYLGWVDPNDLSWTKPKKLNDVGFLGRYQ